MAGEAYDATVKNVEVSGCTLIVNRHNSYVGGLFGVVRGKSASPTLENCRALGVSVKGDGDLGVLTGGAFSAWLKDCKVNSLNEDTLSRLFYVCLVEQQSVGGLVGKASDSLVETSTAFNVHFTLQGGGDRPGVSGGYAPNVGTLIGMSERNTLNGNNATRLAPLKDLLDNKLLAKDAMVGSTKMNYGTNTFYTFGQQDGMLGRVV